MKSDFASAAASLNQDQSSAATLAVLNCDLYPKVRLPQVCSIPCSYFN